MSYTIGADVELSRVEVRTCFEGATPQRLFATSAVASDALLGAWAEDGHELPVDEGQIDLAQLPTACVITHSDVSRADLGRHVLLRGGSLIATTAVILWAPAARLRSRAAVRLRFDLPTGLEGSAPWIPEGDGYLAGPHLHTLSGAIAIVRAPVRRVVEGDVALEIAPLGEPMDVGDEGVDAWLRSAVRAVSLLPGGFPAPRVQFALVSVGPGETPVAFGMVRRGGGASVMLLAHTNASPASLRGDWTAVHELTHLYMPRMSAEDGWLSEGFATYYQEFLQVRAGHQPAQDAWTAIVRGLGQARRSGTGRTLADESRDMRQTRAFRRVYWQGAAFHLELDVMLREHGDSLDASILRARNASQAWLGRDVVDGERCYTGGPEVADLVQRYATSTEVPDLDPLLASMGVIVQDGAVRLDDSAPRAEIRRAIERGD